MSRAGGNPARLRPGKTVYSGKRPSYIILSSPYTCAQFRRVVVHFSGTIPSFIFFQPQPYTVFSKTQSHMPKYHFSHLPGVPDRIHDL